MKCFLQIGGDKDVLPLPFTSKKKIMQKIAMFLLYTTKIFSVRSHGSKYDCFTATTFLSRIQKNFEYVSRKLSRIKMIAIMAVTSK
jgi:hypothetical protein